MKNEGRYIPYHKMGFKLLGNEQIHNMFPEWDIMLGKIEAHRNQLRKLDTNLKTIDSQYNLMYDNIFSIFGKRGSGKTSAIFTLKDHLQSKKGDLVLPVIMPEMIPKGCDMIGWILSLFEQKVLELNERHKKQEVLNRKFDSCMYQPKKTILREYEEVKELCFSQYYKGEERDSMSKSVLNYERKTQNSYNFSARLASFWDILVQELKEAEEMNEEPLIYLIFDDVDLVPDTVNSLFSTIIKYLSHPNLIVFVTADEELLYDVVENDFNHRLGKNDELSAYGLVKRGDGFWGYSDSSKILEEKITERLKRKFKIMEETPRLYCDKILPPASRYYLETFESCERKSTFFCGVELPNNNVVYKSMSQYVEELIQSYIEHLKIGPEKNFLHNDNNFINAYLNFFGNTARQLANERLILDDFVEALKGLQNNYEKKYYENRKQQYFQELYYIIRAFAFNTLNANSTLGMLRSEIQNFVDETILRYPEEWGIYINYTYIKEIEEQLLGSVEEEKFRDGLKQCTVLFMLLFFIENILIVEGESKKELFERQRTKVHGVGNFLDIIRQVTKGNEMLLCWEKTKQGELPRFLFTYEKVIEKIEILYEFDALKAASVRKYLYALPAKTDLSAKKDKKKMIDELYRTNPEWLKTMTVILLFCNEGVYNIDKNMIPSCQLLDQLEVHDEFYTDRMEEARERFCEVVCADRIKTETTRNTDLGIGLRKEENKEENKEEDKEKSKEENQEGDKEENKEIYGCYIYNELLKNEENKNLEKIWEFVCKDRKKSEVLELCRDILMCIGEFKEDLSWNRIKDAVEKKDVLEMKEICDAIVEEIKNSFREFRQYNVKNPEKFDKLIEKADLEKLKISEENQINILQFKRSMQELSEKIQFEKMKGDNEEEELKNIYRELSSNVGLCVETEQHRKEAVKIVVLYVVLDYLERVYLNLQMDKSLNANESKIDAAHIPYQKFYQILKPKMLDEGDYLADVLRRHLQKYANSYYSNEIER